MLTATHDRGGGTELRSPLPLGLRLGSPFSLPLARVACCVLVDITPVARATGYVTRANRNGDRNPGILVLRSIQARYQVEHKAQPEASNTADGTKSLGPIRSVFGGRLN